MNNEQLNQMFISCELALKRGFWDEMEKKFKDQKIQTAKLKQYYRHHFVEGLYSEFTLDAKEKIRAFIENRINKLTQKQLNDEVKNTYK